MKKPKPNLPSRSRITDGQTVGATQGANANSSHQRDSPAASGGLTDKTVDMCQELCKEMTESVLRGINERFDAFEANFQLLVALQAALQTRVADQELATNNLDKRVQDLEAKYSELAKQSTTSQAA